MSGTKCSKNVGRDKGQKKGERGRQDHTENVHIQTWKKRKRKKIK